MNKSVIISEETHKLLKEYAQKKGYKLQYVADEAVCEYLEGKDSNEQKTN
jgi:hypothetical protein